MARAKPNDIPLRTAGRTMLDLSRYTTRYRRSGHYKQLTNERLIIP